MTRLSVIILNFNTRDYVLQCLQSLKEQNLDPTKNELEVIVADNGSTDGSIDAVKAKFPWVKIVDNQKNIGFAAGNNRAIEKARGKLILLLNSDTVVFPESFTKMIKFMDKTKDAGAATARLELPDGALDLACHRGFPTPWNAFTYFLRLEKAFPNLKLFSGYHQAWKNFDEIHEIDAISGACFFIRKKVIDEIGPLDEDYFMYAEDLDWCMRIKKAGWKIYYNPQAKIIHFKKRSGRSKSEGLPITPETRKLRAQTITYFYDTMRIFYDKHYKRKYPTWVRYPVLTGIWLLTQIKLVRNRLI
jgi:GT2 family glycosyltransferase